MKNKTMCFSARIWKIIPMVDHHTRLATKLEFHRSCNVQHKGITMMDLGMARNRGNYGHQIKSTKAKSKGVFSKAIWGGQKIT
jgi:hypothetical protein